MLCIDEPIKLTSVNDQCTRALLVNNDELMMVKFEFEAGGVGEPHSHVEHTQVGYILEGSFELICGDKTTIVKAGDSYLADKGVIHGVVALEKGAILDVFTPSRQEFK